MEAQTAEQIVARDCIDLVQAALQLEDRNEQLKMRVQAAEELIYALQTEISALEAQRDFELQQFTRQKNLYYADFKAMGKLEATGSTIETQVRFDQCLYELRAYLMHSNSEIFVETLNSLAEELRVSYYRQLTILKQRYEVLTQRIQRKKQCSACARTDRKIKQTEQQLYLLYTVNKQKENDLSFLGRY